MKSIERSADGSVYSRSANGASRDIKTRTFDFALEIVSLCQILEAEPGVCRTLSRQLLRSGTSIGANMEEAQAAASRADFINKCTISLKEARETAYWLRLLGASNLAPSAPLSELLREAKEIKRIIGAIIVSAEAKPGER